MSRVLGVCVLSLTLSGCAFQSISVDEINAAKELCKEHNSSLYKINEYFTGSAEVECVDKSLQIKIYSLNKFIYDKKLKFITKGEYTHEQH